MMPLSVMMNVLLPDNSWMEAVALLAAVLMFAFTRRSEALC